MVLLVRKLNGQKNLTLKHGCKHMDIFPRRVFKFILNSKSVDYSTVIVLKIRNKREANDGKPQTKSQMTARKMKSLIKDIQYQYGSVKLIYETDLN